jgi:hypothetical protein
MKKFTHEESGAELIARDEVQAAAFKNAGFVEVKEKKEKLEKN